MSNPGRFPSYKVFHEKQNIKINTTTAEVQLQALQNHTVERIINTQEYAVMIICNRWLMNMCLITK